MQYSVALIIIIKKNYKGGIKTMKKYLLINHYNWDGDWGVSQSLIFNKKEEAQIKIMQLLSYEISAQLNYGNTIVNATDKPNEYLEQEYQKLDSGDLLYWEDFGDSVIFAKYGCSSGYHIEWTIQEIEV
jgi:hypothetical protein